MQRPRGTGRFATLIALTLIAGGALAAGQSIVFDPDANPVADFPGNVHISGGDLDMRQNNLGGVSTLGVNGTIELDNTDADIIRLTQAIGDKQHTIRFDGNNLRFWSGDGAGTVLRLFNESGDVAIPNGNLDVTGGLVHVSTADASGVGVSSNADELILENSGNAGLTIQTPNTDTGNIFFAGDNTGRGGFVYDHSSDDLSFRTANTVQMTLDGSGNVEIPNGNINVSGNHNITAMESSARFLRLDPGKPSRILWDNNDDLQFAPQSNLGGAVGTSKLTITSGGNVRIPNSNLNMSGNTICADISCSNFISGGTSSFSSINSGSGGEIDAQDRLMMNGNQIDGISSLRDQSRDALMTFDDTNNEVDMSGSSGVILPSGDLY